MAAVIGFLIGRIFPSLSVILLLSLFLGGANADVLLLGRNVTICLEDYESAFGPGLEKSGKHGIVYVSEPLNACSPLTNNITNSPRPKFALVIRGECTFSEKVINAQNSGFDLVIVYDDSYNSRLINMAGDDDGINITSVFVTRESGETIEKYAGEADIDFVITPTYGLSLWSVPTTVFIAFLVVCSVFGACCYARTRRTFRLDILPRSAGADVVDQGMGMGSDLVRALPCVVFDVASAVDGDGSGVRCVICLEEYILGDKLRILPCTHRFHMKCIDSWLTKIRTFCPICKQDARKSGQGPPPTETTPLLRSMSFPVIAPPNPSLAHFLPFSNPLGFANRSFFAQVLRLGPSDDQEPTV